MPPIQANQPQAISRAAAWRQTSIITLVAVGLFVIVRSLPVSGNSLHSRDFHSGGKNFLEFCEPGSPQFAPVDRVRSPVTIEVVPDRPPTVGSVVECSLRMTTVTGKRITMDDLFVVHTEKLHLLVIDSSLDDYHHVHPAAGAEPGEFRFSFRPARSGVYRMFADFMPRATGRSLYAGAAMEVRESASSQDQAPAVRTPETEQSLQASIKGLEFSLVPSTLPVRTNKATDLALSIRRSDHAPLRLEEIMGAAAHMVAFDASLSGFAHIHPAAATGDEGAQTAVGALVDEVQLTFALQLSDPGDYRLWAQIKVQGEEVIAPFGLRVLP